MYVYISIQLFQIIFETLKITNNTVTVAGTRSILELPPTSRRIAI